MATKAELRDRVLEKLRLLGEGMNASNDDAAKVESQIDRTQALLEARNIAFWGDVTDIPPEGEEQFIYLVSSDLAEDFSVPNDLAGRIFEMDQNVFDEPDGEIRRIVDLPYVHADQRRVFGSELEVLFRPGAGLTTGQGSNPVAMMRFSDDGGRTFSPELRRDIGPEGAYDTRATWNRLGAWTRRIFRITISDPIEVKIIGALLEADIGA